MAINGITITNAERDSKKVGAFTGNTMQGTPSEAKALFDNLPIFLVQRLNALIEALQKNQPASGAEIVGCAPIAGVNGGIGGTTYEMLMSLKTIIDGIATSGLSPNSISEEYLTDDAVMKSLLTDYAKSSVTSPSALSTADTVAVALGKIEKLLDNILTGVQAAKKAEGYTPEGDIATALANSSAFNRTWQAGTTGSLTLTEPGTYEFLLETRSPYNSWASMIITIPSVSDNKKYIQSAPIYLWGSRATIIVENGLVTYGRMWATESTTASFTTETKSIQYRKLS